MLDALLRVLKALGVFSIFRWGSRRSLLILCYHGFALDDEVKFRNSLFMRREAFEERLKLLAARNHRVLPLDDAIKGLADGSLPDHAVVITIDDGWLGVKKHAWPLLKQYRMPATLYVTTYYVEKEIPVINVMIPYMFWRSQARSIDLSRLSIPDLSGVVELSGPARNETARSVTSIAEEIPLEQRLGLLERLAEELSLDWTQLCRDRLMHLLNNTELEQLAEAGLDLQLHTHRHLGSRRRDDEELLKIEISTNRTCLEQVTSRELVHFCYPNGEHTPQQVRWLKDLGVVSATTTRLGRCKPGCDLLQLPRLLDHNEVSTIRFEAELCGLMHNVRSLLGSR